MTMGNSYYVRESETSKVNGCRVIFTAQKKFSRAGPLILRFAIASLSANRIAVESLKTDMPDPGQCKAEGGMDRQCRMAN